ncbi:site-specific DNA-methyltransferase [bacterium]|nr:site-specific DNA-methyltransferase [bacterium]
MTCTLHQGDALAVLRSLPDEIAQTCVTSPPYWGLRDYDVAGQIGQEATPEEYVDVLSRVFAEVRRVLKPTGTLWLNLGDSYWSRANGSIGRSTLEGSQCAAIEYRKTNSLRKKYQRHPVLKHKDMVGIPWRLAFALQGSAVIPCATIRQWADWLAGARAAQDWEMVAMVEKRLRLWDFTSALEKNGWTLRTDIIWHKPNAGPESVKDRPTKDHEYLFLLSKNSRYYYDAGAIAEPTKPDTSARYERGRSSKHKWSDGGPGNQTIARTFRHMRYPAPSGWDTSPGAHGTIHRNGRTGRTALRGQGSNHSSPANREGRDMSNVGCGPTRNRRAVWSIATRGCKEAHYSTYPPELVRPCILAGSAPGDIVIDPFNGTGTTGLVAIEHGRSYIGIDLNPRDIEITRARLNPTGEIPLCPITIERITA